MAEEAYYKAYLKWYAESLMLFESKVPYIVISYVLCSAIIILNSIEIHLIRKKWKQMTRFEVILLNLASADMLTGISLLAITSIETYYYVKNDYHVDFLTSAMYFIMLSISSAGNFVIVIGIERLSAIGRPLVHRIYHSSKSAIMKWMIGNSDNSCCAA